MGQIASCDDLVGWSFEKGAGVLDPDKIEGINSIRFDSLDTEWAGYAYYDEGYEHLWNLLNHKLVVALKASDPSKPINLVLYGGTAGHDDWSKGASYDLTGLITVPDTWTEVTIDLESPGNVVGAFDLSAVGVLRFGFTNQNEMLFWKIDDVRAEPTVNMGTLECHAYEDSVEVNASVEVVGIGTYSTPFTIDLPAGSYTLNASYGNQIDTKVADIVAGLLTVVNFQFIVQVSLYKLTIDSIPQAISFEIRRII